MSLGVHFALTAAQLKKLHALEGDDDGILEFMSEVEEKWDRAWLVETDKSWDAMHRALTNGKLTFASGKKYAPLGFTILGGASLVDDEDETVVLLEPAQVADAAAALNGVTEAEFRGWYFKRCKGYAPEFGEEDCAYTWSNLEDVRVFFAKAAKAKRAVVFAVSA